jgi:zinc/manganese transport system permease protein
MTELLQILGLPLLACIVIGAVLAYLGIHVLKREVIFVDIAVAQVAAVGAIAAHLAFHVEENTPIAYAASFACVTLISAFYALARHKISEISIEAVIGISYAITAAAGLFLIGIAPGHAHAQEMLAGNLLWVTGRDIIWILFAFCLVGVCLYTFRKPLSATSDDYNAAATQGLNVVWWDFMFYLLLGVVITLAVQVGGVVTVFAFLIIPATTSALFSTRLAHRMLIGMAVVGVASVLGLLFSYYLDFSIGPPVTLFLGILLGLAALFGKCVKGSRTP